MKRVLAVVVLFVPNAQEGNTWKKETKDGFMATKRNNH